ncbi:MAG TPA: dihydroorotate dehydrogenase [Smithellaceae bacterium]|jgi:dihydroorotate dehydrogenase (NAD+) catalytic subunit|nr:MAG: Dihydroorotate dehydrogenase B (NAD(+)), catalytic subunit [Deltaproteobacteria bacterium ADurb.BinA014]HNQ19109.1 dihydroorotate dehydrogenase [Smithellaceae bacterium]HNT90737.1 dihydroorotate dehydrogenase [Smithellaceae bacterium]HNV64566.1 dihydroorotate dehydrogenase [Smithellaceae bacterium]HNZ30488.1 dihydroorotate dehydrogenase [Smithellaceae bacterium]
MAETKSINMSVKIGTLKLKNPVMTASGTFGYGGEYADYVDLNKLGAIVVKGLSLKPRAGNPPPRIMETPSGMLNAVGLQNIGVDTFIEEKLPILRKYDTNVIANIYGETYDEYKKVAQKLTSAKGVHALEVNISCPNVRKGGLSFGADLKSAAAVTRKVKEVTDLPVIVKLTPNVTDITAIAAAVEKAGADAISLINTLTGMSVDIFTRRPHLKNVTGGLSGPAIKPVALRMVWQVLQKISIPVIGIGGIMNAEDALEFLILGTKAVQIGTANFINPQATIEIIGGIERYMELNGIKNISKLIGTFRS